MVYNECVRALYEAAADLPPASFPAAAMRRAARLIPCAALLWQVADERGGVALRRALSIDLTFGDGALDAIVLTEPEAHGRDVAGLTLTIVTVQLPPMSAPHHIGFARALPAGFSEREAALLVELAQHMVGAEQLCCRIAGRGERSAFAPHPEHRTDPAAMSDEVRFRKSAGAGVLSDRESEIARRVGAGLTFKEIARELGLAPSTVSTHLYNLYAKLGIRRRAELVQWLSPPERLSG
ncbi:MAG TPA: helix-turn-helix transcriptional regulator [Solimonas sp.]|nr:helix-turn-helix transcriptional regulator [Solimonas sp.]